MPEQRTLRLDDRLAAGARGVTAAAGPDRARRIGAVQPVRELIGNS